MWLIIVDENQDTMEVSDTKPSIKKIKDVVNMCIDGGMIDNDSDVGVEVFKLDGKYTASRSFDVKEDK